MNGPFLVMGTVALLISWCGAIRFGLYADEGDHYEMLRSFLLMVSYGVLATLLNARAW